MAEPQEYARRQAAVRRVMAQQSVDCLLLNQSQNIKYLTGVSNTCTWLLLRQDGRMAALVMESDYPDYRRQSGISDVRTFRFHDPMRLLRDVAIEFELAEHSLAIEKNHLRYSQYEMLEGHLGAFLRLDACADDVVQEARVIKTPDEITLLEQAGRIAELGMRYARAIVTPGMTEAELAQQVVAEMWRAGAGGRSSLYVASGIRSGLAHAPASANRIERGPVVLDIHSEYHGYHSDLARTILLDGGTPQEVDEQHLMYQRLREGIRKTVAACCAGLRMAELKEMFYDNLKRQNDWILLTGPIVHGVGVVNAELPRFEYPHYHGHPACLEANMVLALSNIGLSSPSGWGVRYEDTFVVTEAGPQLLTGEDYDLAAT